MTGQSAREYGVLGARKTPPVSPSVSHMLKKAFEGAGSTERKSDERCDAYERLQSVVTWLAYTPCW